MKPENLDKALELKKQLNLIENYNESLIGAIENTLNVNIPILIELHLISNIHKGKNELALRYRNEIELVLNKYFNEKRIKFETESEKEKQRILKEIETL